MLRILIADDHSVVRKGLKLLLLEEFPDAHVEETEDAESLVKMVIKEKWDIVVSDIDMPGRSGLDALLQIKEISPDLPVLILSLHAEEQYAIRAMKAGASGYLSKKTAPAELVEAVHKILLGKKYISDVTAEKLVGAIVGESDKAPHELLSNREFDVMKLLASGKTTSDIATAMSLSGTTISTYRTRIMAKLQLKTNSELTRYAIDNKLV